MSLFQDELGFTDEELENEFTFWKSYVRTRVPKAYPGIREIQERQKREGGLVCVVSHSMEATILRDYRENGLPAPDRIFGWDYPAEQRKPCPYPIEQLEREFGLRPEELLVIDDLKPGYDMGSILPRSISMSASYCAPSSGQSARYVSGRPWTARYSSTRASVCQMEDRQAVSVVMSKCPYGLMAENALMSAMLSVSLVWLISASAVTAAGLLIK